MTRFIYLSDTHLGGGPDGYQQQKRYADRLREIVAALRQFITQAAADDEPIDFVLHGGDMIDATTNDAIRTAASLFDLPVPVHLCLGNHDITTPDAVDRWLVCAPQLFPSGEPDATLRTDDCVIHIAPNHWDENEHYWSTQQEARLSDTQLDRLRRELAVDTDRPHVLLTHSPVMGMPSAQSGMDGPLHGANASFVEQVLAAVTPHPHVACVLGAHSHMNTCVEHGGVRFVTSSSFVETPFEFKLFEAARDRLAMRTVSLDGAVGFRAVYDYDRTHVQGRAVDRGFVIELD